ncbi:MAG: hypothetical protein EOP48_08020 [Sphingobacteriales bacterium]|nr:MAG: hypothetical protein EOP48_08020 [Sphingobacteriales bacterium]
MRYLLNTRDLNKAIYTLAFLFLTGITSAALIFTKGFSIPLTVLVSSIVMSVAHFLFGRIAYLLSIGTLLGIFIALNVMTYLASALGIKALTMLFGVLMMMSGLYGIFALAGMVGGFLLGEFFQMTLLLFNLKPGVSAKRVVINQLLILCGMTIFGASLIYWKKSRLPPPLEETLISQRSKAYSYLKTIKIDDEIEEHKPIKHALNSNVEFRWDAYNRYADFIDIPSGKFCEALVYKGNILPRNYPKKWVRVDVRIGRNPLSKEELNNKEAIKEACKPQDQSKLFKITFSIGESIYTKITH